MFRCVECKGKWKESSFCELFKNFLSQGSGTLLHESGANGPQPPRLLIPLIFLSSPLREGLKARGEVGSDHGSRLGAAPGGSGCSL